MLMPMTSTLYARYFRHHTTFHRCQFRRASNWQNKVPGLTRRLAAKSRRQALRQAAVAGGGTAMAAQSSPLKGRRQPSAGGKRRECC